MAEVEAKFLIRSDEQVDQVMATLDELGYLKAGFDSGSHVDTYFAR